MHPLAPHLPVTPSLQAMLPDMPGSLNCIKHLDDINTNRPEPPDTTDFYQ
jgi:hypothetical protein